MLTLPRHNFLLNTADSVKVVLPKQTFSRSRDQRPPGSFLHKREEPGNEVAKSLAFIHHLFKLFGFDRPIIGLCLWSYRSTCM
jgi:hypothetical protein